MTTPSPSQQALTLCEQAYDALIKMKHYQPALVEDSFGDALMAISDASIILRRQTAKAVARQILRKYGNPKDLSND